MLNLVVESKIIKNGQIIIDNILIFILLILMIVFLKVNGELIIDIPILTSDNKILSYDLVRNAL